MTDIKVGDRVRVTFEGTVGEVLRLGDNNTVYGLGFVNQYGNGSHTIFTNQEGVTVEKVEPPVETFGPGDLVRSKVDGGIRALASHGYVRIPRGEFFRYDDGRRGAYSLKEFTSKNHERVEV